MAKIRKTAEEIEALLLEELRKVEHCEGARSVIIRTFVDGSWAIAFFNAGRSDPDTCQRALWDIEPRLQEQYDLADS